MVPLFFVSVTVPGGCRSQGCHGYLTRSALVLEAPLSFQAPSPSSSIVDEFKNYYRSFDRLLKQYGLQQNDLSGQKTLGRAGGSSCNQVMCSKG